MSEIKDQLLYSEEHEWVERINEDTVRIGITDFAQHQLGDIVFVELPKAGREVAADEEVGTVESVKTASELFCPLAGTVVTFNTDLETEPELVNSDPYGRGWMIELKVTGDLESALSKLMDAKAYAEHAQD
ncbi:glycine cleavage system protein GcvH [Paenibacillus dauci]|uniref:glycine cleavage system protein GcvH n=1 Tax=Paenibacillus dauci TaxID=1567106 RepID=UPI000619AA36|nr:glycine cleavage system protein GcvH [Paenibacillus dauci]